MSTPTLPTVHILMATCQGEAYLAQQLESIEKQSHPDWVLHVSDDGSSDKTMCIIEAFKARMEQGAVDQKSLTEGTHAQRVRVHMYQGPQKGSTENFMHLVRLLGKDACIGSEDLFAFADQDDVWLPKKLEHAVAWHVQERRADATLNERPMLYAAKTYWVDEALRPLGRSKTPKGPLSFNAALVENVLSGNTMVMNKALIQILKCIQVSNAVWHDWSAYMVGAGCEGRLFYDEEPCVLYRQHDKNVIGVRTGWIEQWSRLRSVMGGRYKSWTQANLNGLQDINQTLGSDARQVLRLYESIRLERSAWARFLKARRLSIRRQNRFFQVFLYVGLVLGFV